MDEQVKDEGTLYYVEAKSSGATPRLVRAKSAAAVKAYLVAEQWADPRPAKVADVERAVNAGAKPERA